MQFGTAMADYANKRFAFLKTALALTSGMALSVEIKQGNRTVLEYLVSPLRRVAGTAAQER